MTYHVTSSVYAEYPPLINLVCLLGWLFYNSKISKPNGSASSFVRKNRKTFSYLWAQVRATHSVIAMVGPCTCRSLCRNLSHAGKDEFAEAAPRASTNDSGTSSYTPAVSSVPTSVPAPLFAPTKLVVKYTNADLQKGTKLALKLFVQGQQQAQS